MEGDNIDTPPARSLTADIPLLARTIHRAFITQLARSSALPESATRMLRSLSRRKHRDRQNLSVAEGARLVQSAVQAGVSIRFVVATTEFDLATAGLEPAPADMPVHRVSEAQFARLSDVETAQGILAVVETSWHDEADIPDDASVICLDGVQDPGNAGTILRTAAWLGIDAVVAGAGTVDLFSPKVLRSSMGGVWGTRLVQSRDLVGFLERKRRAGGSLYAADMEGQPHTDWRPLRNAALILGNEGSGLNDDVRRLDPIGVAIVRGGTSVAVESLNVGVAAAILMDAWRNSR